MSQQLGEGKKLARSQEGLQPQAVPRDRGTEKALSICQPTAAFSRWAAMEERLVEGCWARQISLKRAESIEPAEYEWLAEGRVPRGALCVVAGEPGSCKSLLATEWAAQASQGSGEADAALIAQGVDLPAPLIRARLDAASANVERIALAALGWPQPGEDQSFAQLDRRVAALASGMQDGKACKLLIVDNLEAWAGGVDAAPCRARKNYLLAQLADLAARTKTAVVVLARLSGPAGGRVATRELAELSAIAPVVWLAASDADERERRLLLPVKNSLGPTGPAAAFRIEAGRVAWDVQPVEGAAALIAPPSARRAADQHDREGAAEWLLVALSHGPVESGELFKQARKCGISAKTLRRAGKALGLKPGKRAFDGPWLWKLEERMECGEKQAERGARRSECGAGDSEARQTPDFEELAPATGAATKLAKFDRQSSQRISQRRSEPRQERKSRPVLDLRPQDEAYSFAACPQTAGGLAKLAK